MNYYTAEVRSHTTWSTSPHARAVLKHWSIHTWKDLVPPFHQIPYTFQPPCPIQVWAVSMTQHLKLLRHMGVPTVISYQAILQKTCHFFHFSQRKVFAIHSQNLLLLVILNVEIGMYDVHLMHTFFCENMQDSFVRSGSESKLEPRKCPCPSWER